MLLLLCRECKTKRNSYQHKERTPQGTQSSLHNKVKDILKVRVKVRSTTRLKVRDNTPRFTFSPDTQPQHSTEEIKTRPTRNIRTGRNSKCQSKDCDVKLLDTGKGNRFTFTYRLLTKCIILKNVKNMVLI